MSDNVNKPKHYTSHPSGIECIQIAEHHDFCIGNAIKYVFRFMDKSNPIQDLNKAIWYIKQKLKLINEEKWEIFPRDKRYAVSTKGNIKLKSSNKNRKLIKIKNGYLTFMTSNNGKNKLYYVHRVVAETFIGIIPEGMQVCHNDGNKENNALLNLRIDTISNNLKDKIIHNTSNNGEKNKSSKLTRDIVDLILNDYGSMSESKAAEKYNISRGQINRIWNKKNWIIKEPELIILIKKYYEYEKDYYIKEAFKLLSMCKWSKTLIQDLNEAIWYIERKIKLLQGDKTC